MNSDANLSNNTNNPFDYKKFKENYDKLNNDNLVLMNKINTLEKELRDKNKEINRLHYLSRNESSPNNEVLIKYLKEEKDALVEKYEKRIEFLLNENKKLETNNLNAVKRIKIFNDQYPYISDIENKLDELIKKNKSLLASYNEMEKKLDIATKENELFKEQIKTHKENYVPKKLMVENENNYKKLNEDYFENQKLIKVLDQKLKENEASHNSSKNILLTQIKEINKAIESLTKEKKALQEELNSFKKDKESLVDKINDLNMKLLKKDNDIRDLLEKIEESNSKS